MQNVSGAPRTVAAHCPGARRAMGRGLSRLSDLAAARTAPHKDSADADDS